MTLFPEKAWYKSSYSDKADTCVEVALTSDAVGVRDTKNRSAGHLAVSPQIWARFVQDVKDGRHELPE